MAITPTNVLKYEVKDRKLWLTMNRPESMNALNQELTRAIGEAIEEYKADDNLLVCILTGAGGRAFCAGADLKEMTQRDASSGTMGGRSSGPSGMDALRTCWKPVIAAIDGFALGGGLELTVYCDIRIATEQSRLGLPEPRRSLLAGPGLHNLSRLIPLGESMLIQLTGGHMTAQRAYDIGLIQRIAPDREALMKEADAIADEIKLCAPLALQAIKRIVKIGRNVTPEYSEHFSDPIREALYKTEDRIEGPRAFAERREPVWKMR